MLVVGELPDVRAKTRGGQVAAHVGKAEHRGRVAATDVLIRRPLCTEREVGEERDGSHERDELPVARSRHRQEVHACRTQARDDSGDAAPPAKSVTPGQYVADESAAEI